MEAPSDAKNDEMPIMSIEIISAVAEEADQILALVNRFAAEQIMLPRTRESILSSLDDWLVAVDIDALTEQRGDIVGCGALVPLTEDLVELRSLAIAEGQQGRGIGGKLVLALVEVARQREFPQICALTLRENFFVRLGFELVDRWTISPKVWQACIYCPKFHRCDEVAVLMTLHEKRANATEVRSPAWNGLLKWEAWQPLRLAYKSHPDEFD